MVVPKMVILEKQMEKIEPNLVTHSYTRPRFTEQSERQNCLVSGQGRI